MKALKKIMITWSLLSLAVVAIGQSPTPAQIKLLNEYGQKFELVKDDFFPENNRYVHKDMTITFLGSKMAKKNGIYPVVYKNDRFKMISVYHGPGWIFHDKIALKLNEEIIFVNAVVDCTREIISTSIMEECEYLLDLDLIKRLAETPDIKLRYYGKDGYTEMDFNAQIWKDTFIFYRLLKTCNKL